MAHINVYMMLRYFIGLFRIKTADSAQPDPFPRESVGSEYETTGGPEV